MSTISPIVNCYQIESAIKKLFCENNDPMVFKAIDIQNGIATLSRPGFTVAATSGEFEIPDNSGKLEEKVNVVVSLVVKNVASEEQRRMIAHPAVRHVIHKLHHNDLGLDMEPLTAIRWKDVTTEEHLSVSLMVVDIEFTTQFTVVPEAAETNYRELLSISSTFKSELPDHEVFEEGKVVFKEVNDEPAT